LDDILNTTELIDSQGDLQSHQSFFLRLIMVSPFLCSKITRSRISIWSQCKNNKKDYRKFADSDLDLMSDFSLKKGLEIGLMVRTSPPPIMWNIEKEYQKIADAVPGQNQELPESTEITAPKAQLDF
jgi:hypothetical protein